MYKNMSLGIFSEGTGLREKLRLASVGGFEGVDIDIKEATALLEKYSPAYVKGMIDSFNLKAGAWTLPFAVDAEEDVYAEGMKNLERYVRTAKEINVLRVLVAGGASPDKTRANLCRERFAFLTKLLKKDGCTVALDCPGGCNADMEDAGLVLNARRWHLSGGSVEDLKKISKDRVVYVRLGDVSVDKTGMYLPGETGVVDLAGFLSALAEIHYDGPVAPELPDRNLLTLPEEMAVRFLGGSLLRVWTGIFKETSG